MFSSKILIWPTLARFAFFPLFVLMINPWVIKSNWVACIYKGRGRGMFVILDVCTDIVVFLFAFSNGYMSSTFVIFIFFVFINLLITIALGMIYGPQKVASHEKQLTGILMVCNINIAIIYNILNIGGMYSRWNYHRLTFRFPCIIFGCW